MPDSRQAPTHWQVIWAIARRELGIAARRKLVRFLFLVSTGIPLGMAIALVVRVMTRQAVGVDTGWDPVQPLLEGQMRVVWLLALGLGTPGVARDRSEEVLYLYAVRPVSPWTYTFGKMLAVALPALLLLLLPGMLLAAMRQGILPDEVTTMESLGLIARTAVVALFIGISYAGVTVGASAATRRGRWALLIALAIFLVPDALLAIFTRGSAMGIGPANAAVDLLDGLFESENRLRALSGMVVLTLYTVAGAWITSHRVRREMIP
jgi:ABC-type transport system involved in multi-copper enzyme maturation permease subunit